MVREKAHWLFHEHLNMVSMLLSAQHLLPFLPVATVPSLLYNCCSQGASLRTFTPGIPSAIEHLKNLLSNWTPPDSPNHSLQAALDADQLHYLLTCDRAHLNSIYTQC